MQKFNRGVLTVQEILSSKISHFLNIPFRPPGHVDGSKMGIKKPIFCVMKFFFNSEIHIFAPTIFFRETRCEYGVLPQSSQRRRRGRRDVVSPDCRRWPLAGKSEALSSLEADIMKHLKFYSP